MYVLPNVVAGHLAYDLVMRWGAVHITSVQYSHTQKIRDHHVYLKANPKFKLKATQCTHCIFVYTHEQVSYLSFVITKYETGRESGIEGHDETWNLCEQLHCTRISVAGSGSEIIGCRE